MTDGTRAARTLAALGLLAGAAAGQVTELASLDWRGIAANGACDFPALSTDGRWVAFESDSTSWVAGDTNGKRDVFLHDRHAGTIRRVSLSSTGLEPNQACHSADVSGDGSVVAFASASTNLVAGDTNGTIQDIFVHLVASGETVRVNVSSTGVQANGSSSDPALSADGRYVAFASLATNLVPGDSNVRQDVFVHDRTTGVTLRASLGPGGSQSNGSSSDPRLSGDGRSLAFHSDATNLIVGDGNGHTDVFLRDLALGVTRSVTSDPALRVANSWSESPDLSWDGQLVSFVSGATNLVPGDSNGQVDVFVFDALLGKFERASLATGTGQANGSSYFATISDDGQRVAFLSGATNLTPNDGNGREDVFLRDLAARTTARFNVGPAGGESNGTTYAPTLSGDGRFVGFASDATNLVAGDVNFRRDIFVHGPPCSDQTVYCTAKTNSAGCVPHACSSGSPTLAGDDDFFVSARRVLNGKSGIFFWGLAPDAKPWRGGLRCVRTPLRRTPVQDSGGSPTGSDCSGSYSFHFSQAYMAARGLLLGTTVYGQYWSRDPGLAPPDHFGLTDAIAFTLEP